MESMIGDRHGPKEHGNAFSLRHCWSDILLLLETWTNGAELPRGRLAVLVIAATYNKHSRLGGSSRNSHAMSGVGESQVKIPVDLFGSNRLLSCFHEVSRQGTLVSYPPMESLSQ